MCAVVAHSSIENLYIKRLGYTIIYGIGGKLSDVVDERHAERHSQHTTCLYLLLCLHLVQHQCDNIGVV